jgi:hypothetical protein
MGSIAVRAAAACAVKFTKSECFNVIWSECVPHPDVTDPVSLDRSSQYTDATPAKLLTQLNENWKQLRLLSAAVADRDKTIDGLYKSLDERDRAIELLNERLRYAKVRLALLYSVIGGIASKVLEVVVLILLKAHAGLLK